MSETPNRRLKPLPRKSNEVVNDQITPYHQDKVNGENAFTKERANDISQKDDKVKNFTVGLQDIDEAVQYYFDNVIKPSVVIKGQRVPVPVSYGNQELWKTIQADGYTRDKNGKIMTPLLMFKRDAIEKNRQLGNKLDANSPHLYQVFERKYTQHNRYDAFSALGNREPVKQYVVSVIPDYVTVTYSCIVFTEFMEQINPIIEAINYAEGSYWGDLNRYKFRARIDSFNTVTELNVGDDRACKANFNIIMSGYIIPETINQEIKTHKRFFSKAQVVFQMETVTVDLNSKPESNKKISSSTESQPYILDREQFEVYSNLTKDDNVTTTTLFEGQNISNSTTNITNITNTQLTILEAAFIALDREEIADVVNADNFTFNNVGIVQPPVGSALPATTKSDFVFHANGLLIPDSCVISVTERGNMVDVVINTTSLGYVLISTDELTGRGKFETA